MVLFTPLVSLLLLLAPRAPFRARCSPPRCKLADFENMLHGTAGAAVDPKTAASMYERSRLLERERERKNEMRREMTKQEWRARVSIVNELTRTMVTLSVPGDRAIAYAERFVQLGIRFPKDLPELPADVLDLANVQKVDRIKLQMGVSMLMTVPELDLKIAGTLPARYSGETRRKKKKKSKAPSEVNEEEDAAETMEVRVDEELAGLRVDAALAKALSSLSLSRTYFGSLCADGRVTKHDSEDEQGSEDEDAFLAVPVDEDGSEAVRKGRVVKKSEKVQVGDLFRVRLRAIAELQVEPEELPLEVLYEDDQMLVVNKAAGMVVHPSPGHWNGTFVNALLHHVRAADSLALPDMRGDGLRLGIVHRLDRYTTGALIAAKQMGAQRELLRSFAERRVFKLYIGVIVGQLGDGRRKGGPAGVVVGEDGDVEVSLPIGRHKDDRLKMSVKSYGEGRSALTTFKTLATNGRYSLVCGLLSTGRTHQIRVHLQHLRHPIIGDPLYGDSGLNKRNHHRAPRPMLHAYQVRISHPTSGEHVTVVAPPPDDIADLGTSLAGCHPQEFHEWLKRRVDSAFSRQAESFSRTGVESAFSKRAESFSLTAV